MPCITTISIDDNLFTGPSRITCRTADDETAGGIDEIFRLIIQQLRRDNGRNHHSKHVLSDPFLIDRFVMLTGDHDRFDPFDMAVRIFHGHLRFSVRPQIRQLLRFPQLRNLLGQLIRQHDRQRHQLWRLLAGIAEHQSLIACSQLVRFIVRSEPLFQRGADPCSDIR